MIISYLKEILGITALEQKVKQIEKSLEQDTIKPKTLQAEKKEILNILQGEMTTTEIAGKLHQSRSWTSHVLNRLEREGKVREVGKRGRKVVYERKKNK